MSFSVYSLKDVRTVLSHPDCGQCVLSDAGGGRVTISTAGDMAANTKSATGYVTINKMDARDGVIGLEVPMNSDADNFLRVFCKTLAAKPTNRFGLGVFTLNDTAAGRVITCTGVVPQKVPDDNYDQQASNRQYNLLYAEKTEQ